MSEPSRKVCYERLFDSFKEAAKQWLEDTPEARGLYLVVDWSVGKNDFPPAHMVCKDQPTGDSVLDSLKQSLKLTELLAALYAQHIENLRRQQTDK